MCTDCNMCVESCPVKAIDRSNKQINYEACIECLCCHELCQFHAVKLQRVNPVARMMMRGKE
ncbi:MAG: 4Fe-4S binding protein [Bacillota bacterium]